MINQVIDDMCRNTKAACSHGLETLIAVASAGGALVVLPFAIIGEIVASILKGLFE